MCSLFNVARNEKIVCLNNFDLRRHFFIETAEVLFSSWYLAVFYFIGAEIRAVLGRWKNLLSSCTSVRQEHHGK